MKKIISAIFVVMMTMPVWAQKLSLGYLYPAGGQVGTTVEIEAGGLNINKATKVVFNHQGITGEVLPYVEKDIKKKKKRKRLNDQSSPQLADRVVIRINMASNVPCGLYDLRLQGPQGVSNMLPFEVSSYPDFRESGKSRPNDPDVIPGLPAVLCGQVTPGGVDYFRFSGHKGEMLVAYVKGRQLVPYIADAVPGWFQPVIKIVDSKGREVAYSDDYLHNVDPVIMTELPADGDYTLMIHDAIYRGREDFNYRIQLGVIPFVTGRYPAYGVVGKKVRQYLEGVNLNSSSSVVSVKKPGYHKLAYTARNGTSNPVSFYALPKGTNLTEYPEGDCTLDINHAISDSLTSDSRIKRYKVKAQGGQPLIVELIGRRNDSKIDAVMKLVDRSGNVVALADDTEDPTQGLMTFHADPVLCHTTDYSEDFTLEVEDLHGGYGKDYHYLLRLHRQLPSFNAFVSPANVTVPSGGTASFRVDIAGKVRKPAYLEVTGLPKGFTTSSLEIRGGKSWDVSVTSPEGAAQKRFPVGLRLKYFTKEGEDRVDVLPADNMMQAFYYIHHIQASELSVEVAAPSPYRLSLDMDIEKPIAISLKDEMFPVTVRIDREPDFTDPVALELGKKNRTFALEPVSIMPEETEKTIYIKLDKTALAKYKGKKFKPTWQMNIVGTVKGELVKRGKRTFQNAKYREMTPYFLIRVKK